MSVTADAARVHVWPVSRPPLRAELPDHPLDETPPLPSRPLDVTTDRPLPSENYRVISAQGLTLGKFSELPAARTALNTWSQAVVVVSNSAVVERKRR